MSLIDKCSCRSLEIPPVKQPLGELIRRQQSGRPLEDAEPTPILERKQGHWPGEFPLSTAIDLHLSFE